MKKLEDYIEGEAVEVNVYNPERSTLEWVKGKVLSKGYIHPKGGGRPYPKLEVQYTHTYWKNDEDHPHGGFYYNKFNSALFLNDNEVKPLN